MHDIKEILKDKFQLQSMIAIFKTRTGNHFLQSHEVYVEKGNAKLAEGIPLSEEAWKNIAKMALKNRKVDDIKLAGLVPENVIYFQNEVTGRRLVWWEPAQKQYLHFVSSLHISSGVAMVPPLIFRYREGGIDVYAFKENARPNLDTKLYSPPFHNCASNGAVCMGSAKVKKSNTMEEIMESWSTGFWKSEFSHTNDERNVKGNINMIWKSLIGSDNRFPLDVLKSTKLTVKDLIK